MKQKHDRNLPARITRTYLADAMTLQSEKLKRLSGQKSVSLHDMGAVMEGIANSYLDIAEAIRQNVLKARANGGARAPSSNGGTSAGRRGRGARTRD